MTILEPVKVNDEAGAQIIFAALEKAENTSYKKEKEFEYDKSHKGRYYKGYERTGYS